MANSENIPTFFGGAGKLIGILIGLCCIFMISTKGVCFMKSRLNKDEERLLQHIEEFNKSIRKKGWNLTRKIIDRKDASGIHVVGSVWKDVEVKDSKFRSSRFEDTTFVDVKFNGADFSNSLFTRCSFQNCQVINSTFSKSAFSVCSFAKGRFADSNFNEVISEDCVWNDMELFELEWRYGSLTNVGFNKGKYEEVAFSNSKLYNVNFSDSKLIRSGFSGAEISRCHFKIEGNVVNFTDAKCDHLIITGNPTINDLNIAGIRGDDIVVENLDSSEMLDMSFSKVDKFYLKNSTLSYTSCISATFSNAIFENVVFNFALFEKSRFEDVKFKKVTFSGEVIFDGASFHKTSFTEIKKSSDYQGSYKNTVFEEKEPF